METFSAFGASVDVNKKAGPPYRKKPPSRMAAEEVLNSFANCETLIFLRSVLRSEENLLQNCAILRNALRKLNEELPNGSNAMQSGETLRNSLGLN
jgi:hypothetical protein